MPKSIFEKFSQFMTYIKYFSTTTLHTVRYSTRVVFYVHITEHSVFFYRCFLHFSSYSPF